MENRLMDRFIISKSTIQEFLDNPINLDRHASMKVSSWIKTMGISLYGKTFYLVYGSHLRQFKIIKSILFPTSVKWRVYDERISCVTLIDIAGIGEVWVTSNMWGHSFEFKFYASIEDFKNEKYMEWGYSSFKFKDVYKGIASHDGFSTELPPVRWYWNGTNATPRVVTDFPVFVVVNENGISFTPEVLEYINENYSGYATKEECEKDNEIKVVCFAEKDEKPKTEDKVVGNFFGVDFTLTKEQLNKVQEYINAIK